MSWDVNFNGKWWNFTHNCNGMIDAVLQAEPDFHTFAPHIFGSCWWERLNGMSAEQGHAFLSYIIEGLEHDPIRFRAMNPENGWGSYDRLLEVLREMRDASVFTQPPTWEASG